MKPFVKWAGGKRQILAKIKEYIEASKSFNNDDEGDKANDFTYIEPFLGGGAVFFDLHPQKAIINDLNSELMNAYSVIKSDSYKDLINLLAKYQQEYHSKLNNPEDEDGAENYYYKVRQYDRDDGWPSNKTDVERAARMIFLNRTCYNGLYRVNSKGQFNTPIGRYKNPLICDKDNLTEIHNYFSDKQNNICIMCGTYDKAIDKAERGDIIYADPPYDYEDDDGFTKYQMSGFTFEDFEKLKKSLDKAINRGATVIISNNSTEKVINLFNQDPKYKVFYLFEKLSTLRSINSNGDGRQTGREVIILGMQNILPQANSMERIIKFAMLCDNELLKDKKQIMEKLNLTTERQVLYYLQALQYLRFINQLPEYTERITAIYDDENKIKEDIYNQLIENKLFSDVYNDAISKNKNVNIEYIVNEIEHMKINLAPATIRRRASTIKAWVEWMISYKGL